jgi:hypothetical protein
VLSLGNDILWFVGKEGRYAALQDLRAACYLRHVETPCVSSVEMTEMNILIRT